VQGKRRAAVVLTPAESCMAAKGQSCWRKQADSVMGQQANEWNGRGQQHVGPHCCPLGIDKHL